MIGPTEQVLNLLRIAAVPNGTEYRPLEWALLADPVRISIALAVLVAGIALVAANWWRAGRDRIYEADIHMSDDRSERVRPLFHRQTIVVEYDPPAGLRPAQIGVLLHERPGTREYTATFADLAARGYMAIEETSVEGHTAWTARRLRAGDDLQAFERTLLDGLFANGEETLLAGADLDHYMTMRRAESNLLNDTVTSGYFAGHADSTRTRWLYIGIAVFVAGLLLVPILGAVYRLGLVALSVSATGLLIAATHSWMPRRTALGSEMLRRCIGFRTFVAQGEGARHVYNEQSAIFAKYVGYAIVFGVTDRWAKAFERVNTTDIARVYMPPPERRWSDILGTLLVPPYT